MQHCLLWFSLPGTVTTVQPELGKLMYKDYKQVRVQLLLFQLWNNGSRAAWQLQKGRGSLEVFVTVYLLQA